MIRPFRQGDEKEFYKMAHTFHFSDAVEHDTPDDNSVLTFTTVMKGDPRVDGYIIEQDGQAAGFGLVGCSTYSNECGGMLYNWDELYVKPEFRGHGLGTSYIKFCEDTYRERAAMFRMEVEEDHDELFRLYGKLGYKQVWYRQVTKFRHDTVLPPFDSTLARPFVPADEQKFCEMARTYHDSGVFELTVTEKNFHDTFKAIMDKSPFIDGFMLERDGRQIGYALVCIMYANEAGGLIMNVDELYIDPEYNSREMRQEFVNWFENHYKDTCSLYRLELAGGDEQSIEYYESKGYELLRYYQVLKKAE